MTPSGIFSCLASSELDFAHAHRRGGKVENDMAPAARRDAEGHGLVPVIGFMPPKSVVIAEPTQLRL
jgi:hypothetical protein